MIVTLAEKLSGDAKIKLARITDIVKYVNTDTVIDARLSQLYMLVENITSNIKEIADRYLLHEEAFITEIEDLNSLVTESKVRYKSSQDMEIVLVSTPSIAKIRLRVLNINS